MVLKTSFIIFESFVHFEQAVAFQKSRFFLNVHVDFDLTHNDNDKAMDTHLPLMRYGRNIVLTAYFFRWRCEHRFHKVSNQGLQLGHMTLHSCQVSFLHELLQPKMSWAINY